VLVVVALSIALGRGVIVVNDRVLFVEFVVKSRKNHFLPQGAI
jgi:hypothetical protein